MCCGEVNGLSKLTVCFISDYFRFSLLKHVSGEVLRLGEQHKMSLLLQLAVENKFKFVSLPTIVALMEKPKNSIKLMEKMYNA